MMAAEKISHQGRRTTGGKRGGASREADVREGIGEQIDRLGVMGCRRNGFGASEARQESKQLIHTMGPITNEIKLF